VRTANCVQLMAAGFLTLPLAWFEADPVMWHPDLWLAMAWSVLGLTLGGSSLLYLLIQRGAAASVASLMYLVPPTTALMAWVLFKEPLTMLTLMGIALTAMGVSLVIRKPAVQAS
jgi:drug/metabolite transporter (DMT)-like permease